VTDAVDQFRRFIESTCGTDPGPIIADGRWHRFNIEGTRHKSSKPGRYLLHADEKPVGVFMDWRDEAKRHRWFSDSSVSSEDRTVITERRRQRDRERKANFDRAAEAAQAYWGKAVNGTTAAEHPYLQRKQIQSNGARVKGEGLLIPLYNVNGELRTLQQIAHDGSRLFWRGSEKAGCYCPIGDFSGDGPIVLCEGFSTGASIHEATGYPVAACIDASNMVEVSRWAGHKWAGRPFIVAGEDDWHLPERTPPIPNKGKECAGHAARNLGARLIFPDMHGLVTEGGDDFNDMAAEFGLEAVASLFATLATPEEAGENGSGALLKATPFAWRPTDQIPKREWLYGKHLLRKFVSLDVAAGGVGKSSLKVGEALAMASGQDFYGKGLPEGALSVWLYNLEDPHDETERRLHATAQHFGIQPQYIEDRLYVDSGRDQPLIIATEGPDGAQIARPVVDALIAEMLARKIDVLSVDPFISSHQVSENDNNAIDLVAREWNIVAEKTNAAINLVHHVRKQNGAEATADSARGASALIGKARSVLVYNRMSVDEANTLGVDQDERRFFFRVDNDKANLAPAESGDWYRMNNVDLANGDKVGVACPWTPPDLFDGITARKLYDVQKAVSEGQWRENIQTGEAWVGVPICAALGIDSNNEKDRKKASRLLKAWLREGAFEVVEMLDNKRMQRKFVVVGRWVEL
jgi:hypothetical protein